MFFRTISCLQYKNQIPIVRVCVLIIFISAGPLSSAVDSRRKKLFSFVVHLFVHPFRAMETGLAALLNNEERPETPSGSTSARGDGAPPAKRTCLRHYDQVSKQVFNAMGSSGVETYPLKKLYDFMKAGNKGVKHFSNLCYDEPKRQRIGMSQTCEVLEATLERFIGGELHLILKEDIFKRARAEATALLPYIKTLNTGPLPDASSRSASSVAFYGNNQRTRPIPNAAVTQEAAGKLFDFLSDERSILRGLLKVLSSGGIWYNAAVWEKAMRAWRQEMGITRTGFQTLAVVVESGDGPDEETPTALFASSGAEGAASGAEGGA